MRSSKLSTFQLMRRAFSTNGKIKERDVLFLRQQGTKYPKWHLTEPLRHKDTIKLSYGASVAASDLIGKKVLDTVKDTKGNTVLLQEPTLSTYIVNSERHATPIYPHDANTIVSLLDLNPSRPGEDDPVKGPPETEPVFEIFEAGTGMGSLTLHMARAIHAANPPLPPALRKTLCSAKFRPIIKPSRARIELDDESQEAYDKYKASRRAVIHTLDNKPKQTQVAYKLVRNFKRALYLPSIDFHLGSIDNYLSQRLEETGGKPFLARAILDLPAAHEHAHRVVEALLPNGILIVFKPSISQIGDFQKWALETAQPLRLEKVLELPMTTSSDSMHDSAGGRRWDIKMVAPRADKDANLVQVMRPKVGEKIAGGGFLAVLRRWSDDSDIAAQEPEVEREVEDEDELSRDEEDDDDE